MARLWLLSAALAAGSALAAELGPEQVDFGALAAALEQRDPAPRSLKRAFTVEKLMALDACQRFARDEDGDGRYEVLALPPEIGGTAGQKTLPPQPFEALVAPISEWYGKWDAALAKEHYAAARPAIAELERELAASTSPSLALMAPSLSRAVQIHARAAAERRGTHLVLRLHAHRAQQRAWPRDLQDFVPAGRGRLDLDPLSGQRFIYRLQDGQPLLYSIGEDAKDDGGQVYRKDDHPTWGETGDCVFWPRPR